MNRREDIARAAELRAIAVELRERGEAGDVGWANYSECEAAALESQDAVRALVCRARRIALGLDDDGVRLRMRREAPPRVPIPPRPWPSLPTEPAQTWPLAVTVFVALLLGAVLFVALLQEH